MYQHVRVVVDAAARDEAAHVREEPLHLQPGDVAGEMLGMRPDVADRAGAGTRRIGEPK